MTPLSCFTLRGEPATREGPQGSLLHEGRETGLRIHAASLEAQFQLQPGFYLLFFTDNSPYEEALQIVLLDARLQFLDGLELGQPYTPGILSGIHAESEQRILFDFFEGTRLLLSIHPEGRFHLIRGLPPFARPLEGRFFSRHYLTLQEVRGIAKEK
ncbi:hypothetical protein [Archangium violaceum]|uniref:hypothetical protein n=1 Tax=Archangium violaceum TaxID=83451 RepID=UPI000697523D|nr:hypothetical protein [Archangium violaceum]